MATSSARCLGELVPDGTSVGLPALSGVVPPRGRHDSHEILLAQPQKSFAKQNRGWGGPPQCTTESLCVLPDVRDQGSAASVSESLFYTREQLPSYTPHLWRLRGRPTRLGSHENPRRGHRRNPPGTRQIVGKLSTSRFRLGITEFLLVMLRHNHTTESGF